jgi:malonyl-CoA O-methyltransferase
MNHIKQNIRNSFGKNVDGYVAHGNVQKKVARILFDQVREQADAHDIKRVVELGCGTGFLSEYVVNYFKDAQHFVSDLSCKMAKRCRTNLFNIRANYFVCDGEELPFEKNFRTNLLVANMALHWFQKFETSIQNLSKITDMFAFSIPVQGTFKAWTQAHETLGIRNRMIPFLSISELETILSKIKPKKLSIKVVRLLHPANSTLAFLRHLKVIGASTNTDPTMPPYTTTELKNLCHMVDKHYRTGIVNYEIAICVLENT